MNGWRFRSEMQPEDGALRQSISTMMAGLISQLSSRPASGSELRMLRNTGPGGFVDVTKELKLKEAQLTSPRSMIAADLNGDGAADLIVTQANGAAVALINKGGEQNHSLRISLKGLADNKSAIGTKVEVFANGLWQKWEVTNTQDIIAGTWWSRSS